MGWPKTFNPGWIVAMAEHFLDSSQTTSLWDHSLPPRLEIEPGDSVVFEMCDASGGQVKPGMTGAEFGGIDKTRIHALNGPVAIAGARPGDVLEIEILEVAHHGWAWTSIIPGMGLLGDRFTEHTLHHWELEATQTSSMPGVTLDLAPFCGVMGLQRAEPGAFRTRPPGPFGGNMDVKHLVSGARLFLPVAVEGAGFCAGDGHAAQGDGEVSINGMEAPLRGVFRFHLHRQQALAGPRAEVPRTALFPRYEAHPWLAWIESDTDPRAASRRVVERAMEDLGKRLGLSAEQSLILCSVVLDLKVSQLVNQPMTTITGFFPTAVFE